MKLSLLDQYNNKTLSGQLTKEMSVELYHDIKKLALDGIQVLEDEDRRKNSVTTFDFETNSKIIRNLVPFVLKSETVQFNEWMTKVEDIIKESNDLFKKYNGLTFHYGKRMGIFQVYKLFSNVHWESRSYTGWFILNKIIQVKETEKVDLFMFYLYLRHNPEEVQMIKQAWAFQEFDIFVKKAKKNI